MKSLHGPFGPVNRLKNAAKEMFPKAYAGYLRWQDRRIPLRTRIAPILASNSRPTYYDDHFECLRNSYVQWWPEYEYDEYGTWARGCERAVKLLKIPELRVRDLAMFEAGCGDGMTSHAFKSYGNFRQVTLNDTEDWRDDRVKSFSFVKGDMCRPLPVESESFDLVITYNTFEHIEDPKAALDQLTRVCKKGGHIHIDFSPLYCSALGLHAFSFLMPYPQFLFSPELIDAKVKELGVKDLGQKLHSLQPTNKWRLAQFRELWRSSGCEVLSLEEDPAGRHLSMVTEFPRAFCGRGLTVEDLVISGIAVTLRKT